MTRKKIIGVCCIAAGLLLGCNGSGSSNSSNNSNTSTTQLPASSKSTSPALYIDTSTAVPVVNGSPTEGVLYVHNTSNTTINGVKFSLNHETTNGLVSRLLLTLGVKNSGIENDKGFRLLDADNCHSIQAGGSCAVKFVTPAVSSGSQGSTVVKMNYTDAENKSVAYHSIVNYQYADISLLGGINFFGGGLNTVTKNGTVQHVTAYLLGGGKPGTVYNSVYLANHDTGNIEVSNGFLNGIQVAAGQVVPVEFLVRANGNATVYSNITPQFDSITTQQASTSKSLTSASLTSTSLKAGSPVSMAIIPTNTYTLNFSGLATLPVPFGGSASESVTVVNNGSQDIPLGQITAISDNPKVTIDNSDCANKILKAYAANTCSIKFDANNIYSAGSANITYKVGTDQVGNDVLNYYISGGNQNATMSAAVNPSYIALRTENSTPQITYVLSYNQYFNYNVTVNKAIQGGGLSNFIITGGTCGITALGSPTALPKGNSCSITGQYTSTQIATLNQKAYLTISGSAAVESITSTISTTSKPLTYTINWQPNVVFTTPAIGITPNITANANGFESKNYTFTIQNQGAATASLSNINLNFVSNTPSGPQPSTLVINNTGIANSCSSTQSLKTNESCNINVVYGPIPATESTNESGIYSLLINYSGGESVYNYTQTTNLAYRRRGNDAYVTVAVSSPNLVDGPGMTLTTPYLATGANNSDQMVVLTYTNQSKNYALSNFLVNTANTPAGLKYGSGGSCNTSSAGIKLESQASCTINFIVDKSYYASASSLPVNAISLIFPSASWNLNKLSYKSPQPYTADGVYKQVYLNYSQAVITPIISYDKVKGSGLLTLTLSNYAGYTTGINFTISDTSQWLESAPSIVGNCNGTGELTCPILSSSGTYTQESITYFMPSYLPSGSNLIFPVTYAIKTGNINVGIPSSSMISLSN